MPVEKRCQFCGAELEMNQMYCSQCGTFDQSRTGEESRFSVIRPKTIEELKIYCREHGIPVSRLGFFVDEDRAEAYANGIIREGERVLVYENAPNGARNLIYSGNDEESAVALFFGHLIDVCHEENIHPERMSGIDDPAASSSLSVTYSESEPVIKKAMLIKIAAIAAVAALLITLIVLISIHSSDGYYLNAGSLLYKNGNKWYYYNSDTTWSRAIITDEDIDAEFLGRNYDPSWGGSEFFLAEDDDTEDTERYWFPDLDPED